MKQIHKLTLLVTALFFAGSFPLPEATAQTSQTMLLARRSLSWRVGVRPARYRVGGLSRSEKCSDQAKMTAFVPPPQTEENVGKYYGPVDTTLSSHPTIWVHLTSMPKNTEVQFTLQDAVGRKELYNTRFTLDAPTGILGVHLPETVPDLKVGESYFWQIAVRCKSDDSSSDLIAIGSWIQRISPEQIKATPNFDPKPLVQELASADDENKPALYASLGVWQDAVTSLIDLQKNQPNNMEFKDSWRSLLVEAQMSEFIDTPILGTK